MSRNNILALPKIGNKYMQINSILVVAMPGHGNFGDDLISLCLTQHLSERFPSATIFVLKGNQVNPFEAVYPRNVNFLEKEWLRQPASYFSRKRRINYAAHNADLLIVGGGGLFQDTHSALTVHKWTKVTCKVKSTAVVAALGVGFGPFQYPLTKWYLRKVLHAFDYIQVRDKESNDWVNKLGFQASVAPDIVAGTQIAQIWPQTRKPNRNRKVLGCSLRPGPWISLQSAVDIVYRAATELECDVNLFVFEHRDDGPIELTFAEKVSAMLAERGVGSSIYCYGRNTVEEFMAAFCDVDFAIACRFHANVIWQLFDVPVMPVSYAPKVESLYPPGKCFTANSLIEAFTKDSRFRFEDHFQVIRFDEKYILPIRFEKNTKCSLKAKLLVGALSIFVPINNFWIHFRRVFKF